MIPRTIRIVLALATSVPSIAGCVDASHFDATDLKSHSSEVQGSLRSEHFDIVQDGSRASRATGMLAVAIRNARGDQETVPSNAKPPLPSHYYVRGTCGVTFIAPHYAITAAHCVSGANLPDPNTWFPVYTYDIRGMRDDWTLEFTTFTSGMFPNYEPLGGGASAADLPGYERQDHPCQVRARCSTTFGPQHNCTIGADIALLYCPLRPRDAEWLPVADADPQTGSVDMYWFHELLSMPTAEPPESAPPEEDDRFTHYTRWTQGMNAANFHYLDSRTNAILPLKSIPWPDGTPRTRLGPGGAATGTDLFGCHGTSGSGVLQRDAQGNHELLGPVAEGASWWQQFRLCTDPDPMLHRPGVFNISYTSNASTQQLETAFLAELTANRGP